MLSAHSQGAKELNSVPFGPYSISDREVWPVEACRRSDGREMLRMKRLTHIINHRLGLCVLDWAFVRQRTRPIKQVDHILPVGARSDSTMIVVLFE